MDRRVPLRGDLSDEKRSVVCDSVDSSDTGEPLDQGLVPLSFAESVHRSAFVDDDGHQLMSSTEATPFTGRPEIDTAMVDALSRAMVVHPGSPVRGHPPQDRNPLRVGEDQLTVGDQSGGEGASMGRAPTCAGRPDIDTAMVEALRRARVNDPRAPDA